MFLKKLSLLTASFLVIATVLSCDDGNKNKPNNDLPHEIRRDQIGNGQGQPGPNGVPTGIYGSGPIGGAPIYGPGPGGPMGGAMGNGNSIVRKRWILVRQSFSNQDVNLHLARFEAIDLTNAQYGLNRYILKNRELIIEAQEGGDIQPETQSESNTEGICQVRNHDRYPGQGGFIDLFRKDWEANGTLIYGIEQGRYFVLCPRSFKNRSECQTYQ